jgi:hypothetical protein
METLPQVVRRGQGRLRAVDEEFLADGDAAGGIFWVRESCQSHGALIAEDVVDRGVLVAAERIPSPTS